MSCATSLDVTRTEELLTLAASAANKLLRTPPPRSAPVRDVLQAPLPADCRDPQKVLRDLATAVTPATATSPMAIAADWLTSASGPDASAACEEAVASWLVDLFGLPRTSGVTFTGGGAAANFTALAAARRAVLARRGWDVDRKGLMFAPPIQIVAGGESHATIFASLRLLGFGTEKIRIIPADAEGRMLPDWLEQTLREFPGPSIVCAQAGNADSGSFDPLDKIAAVVRNHGGWLHVDGSFGLWAATSARFRHLVRGVSDADSWTADAHDWLNVPCDSSVVFLRNPADFAEKSGGHARTFVLWAALQNLGRRGIAELVERYCDMARVMAGILAQVRGMSIANEVTLNQVLVRLASPRHVERDAFTRAVVARVPRSAFTRWQGQSLMRITVNNSLATESDIEIAAHAIADAYRAAERAA